MDVDYGLLRTLHRMLRQQTDIRERMSKGPRMVRLMQNNQQGFADKLAAARESLQQAKLSADRKQLQLGEREAKVEDLKGKLNACDSNKEFQLLKDRIAADEQASSVLSDEILELLENIDELSEKVTVAQRDFEKAQAETKKTVDKVQLENKALQVELERVSAELAAEEKKLPGDLLSDYRRLVSKKNEEALAETNTETCGGCNQRLTTQNAADLLGRKLMLCKGCGCLLYLSEAHSSARR